MTGSKRVFWITQLVGAAIVLWAVASLLDERLGRPASFGRFFLGGLIVHDAAVVPLVGVVTWALRRVVPEAFWATIRNALLATAALSLVAYPFIRGFGRRDVNPSILPRDYAEGLLLCVAVVWSVALAFIVRAWRLQRDPSTSRISSP